MRTLRGLPRSLSPERLAAASARGLTRRRLLGSAGGVALGAGVATLGTATRAEAVCTSAYPCSPSPLCGGSRCDAGDNAQCDYDEGGIEKAVWGPNEQPCTHQSGYINCWYSGSTHCCDCCVTNAGCTTGARCKTQCSTSSSSCPCDGRIWHKCICNGRLV
jgi:hypothetical protein